jgi:hypothetical protein
MEGNNNMSFLLDELFNARVEAYVKFLFSFSYIACG